MSALSLKAAENRYYLDGSDMFLKYGVGVESGSENFLKFPKRKESVEYNWKDQNGLDVDLTRYFIEAREIELKCFLIANSESDFWVKYNSFVSAWQQPETRRLTIVEFSKDYEVFFKECLIYQRLTRIKSTSLVGCKFTLKIVEKNPNAPQPEYITNEEDKFMIS